MRHYTLLLFAFLTVFAAKAQILTPVFTKYNYCPTNFSQVSTCKGWRQPTRGTSDYFNVCAAGSHVGVPQNYFGYQDSPDSCYTGLYTFAPFSLYDYKEYIGTSFAPLTIGQTYTMTITVSLSDSSNYATDGLGVFFSTYPVNEPSWGATLPVTPQIDYSYAGPITDKYNWTTLSQSFVADSAYTNLTLGCFKTVTTLDIDTPGRGTFDLQYAYYYIGNIGIPDPNWHDPNDTTTPPPPVDTTKHTGQDTVLYTFPNAFTPNNDGLNDVFRITGKNGLLYKDYTLSIYNRWGQRVFLTLDPATGWDGTFAGQPQDVGTYFYLAQFTVNGNRELFKGDFTLVR